MRTRDRREPDLLEGGTAVRTRLAIWTGPAAVAAMASAVIAVHAQEPSAPRNLPTIAPAPGSLPTSGGRFPQYGQTSTPQDFSGGGRAPAPQGRPRITQPVIAGYDGVRPASAELPGVPSIPPPPLETPIPSKSPPSPMITMEPTPPGNPMIPAPVIGSLTITPVKERELQPVTPGKPTIPVASGMAVLPSIDTPPPAVPANLPDATKLPVPALTSTAPPTPVTGILPTTSPMVGAPLPGRASPNVTVELVAPESVGVGMPLTYELVVRNVGTAAVSGLRIEDEIPARATLVNTEPVAEAVGTRLTWNLASLEAAGEKRFKVTVKASEEGDIRSRATVSFTTVVDARVRVTRPRVTVAVTGPESARVGERVPFQIQLSNSGTGPANRIVLQAKFSDGLTHPHGALIEAELANLPAGQTKTLTVEATATKAGAQTCSLITAADGNAAESARSTVKLVEPLLAIQQSGPTKCLVRAEPVYEIAITNPGTAGTDPLAVWAVLPEGLEFVSATDAGTISANRTVAWRLPALAAGGSRTLTLKLRASAPTESTIRTTVQTVPAGSETPGNGMGVVSAGHQALAVKPLEARAETAIKAEGVPALRFEVTDVEDPVEVGKEAIYEIKVMNQGTGPCTGVQVVAELPEGCVIAGASGTTTARGSGQQVVFDPIAEFGVKGEAVYRVQIKGTQAGDARFRVRLTCNEVRTPVVKEENTRFFAQ